MKFLAWCLMSNHQAGHDPLVADRTLLGLVPDAAAWRALLGGGDPEAEGHLRVATRTGRPAGDASFMAKVTRLTGRQLARSRPGPPPGSRKGARKPGR